MLVLIPIIFALAGAALLLTHRRYKALKAKEAPRVVVKGHTFSESVEQKPTSEVTRSKVETIRQSCVIGAGPVGAVTAIVLALHNPEVQFCVVDNDERIIEAWNSDNLPLQESGLEDIFFDDRCLDGGSEEPAAAEPRSKDLVDRIQRRRTLSNLTFSTNIHAGVAVADLIFLCLEMDSGPDKHAYLHSTLQTIAHTATGHKIVVQRTTAPYGTTKYIKNHLKTISSPSATFTVLTNPDFTLHNSTLADMLTPQQVIIGHIYSPEASTESIAALKRLYTSWVNPEQIVTMDAWSAELGRIVSKATIAQQMVSLSSVRMLCAKTEASVGNVGWMLGCPDLGSGTAMGMGLGWLGNDVRCFMDLAREMDMVEVAGYWEGVLQMEQLQSQRAIEGIVKAISQDKDTDKRKVIVLGSLGGQEMAGLLRELGRAGATVKVWDGCASTRHVQDAVRAVGDLEGITVAESLEDACFRSGAVVLPGSCRISDEMWQDMADQMEEPKGLLDFGGGVDRVKMGQLGFHVLQ